MRPVPDVATKDGCWASDMSVPGSDSMIQTARDSRIAFLENLAPSRAILLVCLFAFLAYANSLGGDFVFDDTEQIVENTAIRSWDNLIKAFTSSVWAFRDESANLDSAPPSLPYYRPLFTVLLTLGYQLFGIWPQGWHLASLLLHILCSIGVYFVIRTLAQRNTVATLSALLFAVYPVHAESVCWVSGITDPLYGLFFLASFYFYLRFRKAVQPGTENIIRDKNIGLLIASLALFVLASYSKETALSLVVLIFGYEAIESSGNAIERFKRAGLRSLPYFAAALLYLIPRYLVLGENMWSNSQIAPRPFLHTLLTLPLILCSYIFHLVWPINLSVTYNTQFVTSVSSARFILPMALLAFAALTCFAFRRRINSNLWIALLIIFAPLLPVLKIGEAVLEEYLISDRYLYISVAGWTWLISSAFVRFVESKKRDDKESEAHRIASETRSKFGFAAMAVFVVLLTIFAARENLAWADSYSLWSKAARVRPDYWAPHYNRGLALLDMNKPQEALRSLEQAASLKSDEPDIFDATGRAHSELGEREKAISSFSRALDLDPASVESLNNLGTVYFNMGDYAKAEHYFKEALRIRPQIAAARFNLGQCYLRQNRLLESARQFEEYLKSAPSDAQARYELGLVYERSGRKEEAIRQFKMGLHSTRSKELAAVISNSLDRIRGER